MKLKLRFYLLFIYVFISQLAFSQNLVANGDFESYSALPNNISQTYLCNGWSNANGIATPDYLHVSGSGSAQLPNNFFATVSPYSGAAIMGFYTYTTYTNPSWGVPDYREYISTQLSSSMIIGNTYTVSFWLTNGSANHNSGNSSNHIGLKFSSSPLTQLVFEPIGGTPQLEIPNEVWTTTWQQFSFTFIADSSYQFITIGNFYDDALTSTTAHVVNTPENAAYYFIDKIEIVSQNLNIISANSFCLGDSAPFTFSYLNPVNSVLWNFDDPFSGNANISTDPSPTHLFTNPGTYNVRLIAYHGNNSDTVVKPIAIVSTLPTIDLGNDTTLCQGDTLTLDASTPNATCVWNSGSTNPILNVSQPGIYSVVVTNVCGTYYDAIQIIPATLPFIFLGYDTTLCSGATLTLNAYIPNTTCLWNDGSTNPTLNVSQPGSYWVVLTNMNSCGISSDIIEISYISPPSVSLGSDKTFCPFSALTLDANVPNTTYLWSNGSTNPTLHISQPGNYWVAVTNSCGTSSDTIQVSYIPPPTIFLGNDTTLCQGEILTLNASVPNTTCLWNDNSTNPIFNISQPGNYWAAVTNVCGVNSYDEITVNFSQLPSVNLGHDTSLCSGDKLTLDATVSNAHYLWQNSSTNPTLDVTEQGVYWVEVTVNNCSATDTITIDDNGCETILELPNVITANGDGTNDLFVPTVSKGIASMKTTIYNRWGNTVFETNKLSIDWDGQECSDGTYFWIIYYTDESGKENKLEGVVTLIR